jgi:hypothetical protein
MRAVVVVRLGTLAVGVRAVTAAEVLQFMSADTVRTELDLTDLQILAEVQVLVT